MTTLARGPSMFIRNTIVGCWTIGFHYLAVLASGDDYGMGASTNVDNVAEVAVGVVEGVADLLVMALCCYLASHVSFLVPDPLTFGVVPLHLNSDHDARRRRRGRLVIGVGASIWSWDWSSVHLGVEEKFIVIT